jgi:dinuclear metal center YbgI/SA1388 family protein
MTRINDVIQELESWAPPALAADYDNVGLIIGDKNTEISSVLVSLDCTERVVDEAIAKGAGLIVSHHPIVFRGLKKITGTTYVERVLIKAIQNNIALYAIHTNLDSIETGVNAKIAEKLKLGKTRILQANEGNLQKISFFVPEANANDVRLAMHNAGAGEIGNYSHCSFNVHGMGMFKAEEGSDPHLGEVGKIHTENEVRVEMIYPDYLRGRVVSSLLEAHPYEEVAYYEHSLLNRDAYHGSGMIGELDSELEPLEFLKYLKSKMDLSVVKHTDLGQKPIKTVAVCGGSGGFLLKAAKARGADVFISSDFKYHDFFDAEDTVPIVDIGHYESERFTVSLIGDFLRKKFSTFATHLTEVNTNPIQYY